MTTCLMSWRSPFCCQTSSDLPRHGLHQICEGVQDVSKSVQSDEAIFPHCSVVQLWCSCPFLVLSVASSSQHGHPDWSTATQPHTQQTLMCCVVWSLTRLLDWTTEASLCSTMTLLLVHHCATFDKYWPTQSGNTTRDLQIWRCFDPVV